MLFFFQLINAKAEINSTYLDSDYAIADIDTGLYYIKNKNSGLYIDIHGPSTNEGEYIHGWTYHPNLPENWQVVKDNSGYYSFLSPYSNKYIGIDSNNYGANKNNIKQYSTNNNYTKWLLYSYNNEYIIVSKVWEDENLVSKSTNSTDNELQLKTTITTYSTWLFYKQEAISNGTYYIQNTVTRRYMDLYGPSTSDGAIIQQWDINANNLSSISSWRKFQIQSTSDLYYTIKNVYSNKYVWFDSTNNSVKQTSTISDSTKFKFYRHNNGELCIIPKGYIYTPESYSICVSFNSNQNGTPLAITTATSERSTWRLYDASLTYIDRIYNWGYRDTTYRYYFGFYDYDSTIPFKKRTINLFVYNMSSYNTNFSQKLYNAISHSTNEWQNALSPYIYQFNQYCTQLDYDISITAGTDYELGLINPNYCGICSLESSTNVGFVIYQNEIYKVKKYEKTDIIIRNIPYHSNQFYINQTVTHEMGHSVGYAGHTYEGVYSVMNGSNLTDELQPIEINAIKQIYDLFYN